MRTTAVAHLGGKLLAVWVLVTVTAGSCLYGQDVPGPLRLVAIAARNELMPCFERKFGSPVLLDGEAGWPEPVHVVACGTIHGAEGSAVHVSMTVRALIEFKTSKSLLRGKLGRVTAPALDVAMQALEREPCERMGTKPDLRWKAHPTNAGVAVLTLVAELRVVNLRMASHALGTRAWSHDVALVVASLALRLGVTGGEAQPGMVLPDVGDLAPVGLVVARSAPCVVKAALVRIFVTRGAIGSESEISGVSAAIPDVVTVLAPDRRVRAFERPAGLPVIETRRCTARPTDELRASAKVLDMAATAILSPILAAMEAGLSPDTRSQIVVAGETSAFIESPAGAVALAAVGIPFDLGMGTAELSGRQELSAGRSRSQRPSDDCARSNERDEQERGGSAVHCEKIQR